MRFIAGFTCALGLLAVVGVATAYSGIFDVAASTPHSAFERWLLGATMKRSVVAMAASVGDPPPFTDGMIKDGFAHYDDMCRVCHGAPGLDRSEIGKGLNPRPPDLSRAVKEWSPRQLFWIVKNGIKMTGMPSFGATHDDDEVWSIVAFIEKVPEMSAEQYQRIKQQAGPYMHEHMVEH